MMGSHASQTVRSVRDFGHGVLRQQQAQLIQVVCGKYTAVTHSPVVTWDLTWGIHIKWYTVLETALPAEEWKQVYCPAHWVREAWPFVLTEVSMNRKY